jgi:hypothetical protein
MFSFITITCLAIAGLLTFSTLFMPMTEARARQSAATPAAATPISCDVPLQTEFDDATPLASPEASPVSASATPTARGEIVAGDLDRLVRSLAVCLTEGDYETASRLVTPAYRGIIVGTGEELDAETFVAVAESLTATPLTIRSVRDVRIERNERASAEVLSVVANELVRARWTFELVGPETGRQTNAEGSPEPNRRWIVASAEPLRVEPPTGAEQVEVTLVEYAIDLDPTTVDSDAVVLNVENEGELDHEIVVLRLEGDATIDSLIYQPGPTLPEGITFAGQLNVEAGREATLTLVDLEPGDYAVVDLSPGAGGVPNLSRGMGAMLTVAGNDE